MTTPTRTTTIDLTPTWSDLLPAMLAVIGNPEAPQESRSVMYEELAKMARAADAMVKIQQSR
jgi:hypothetical protein